MKTTIINSGKSQINQVSKLYNYPGIKEISGSGLLETMKKQAVAAGTQWVEGAAEAIIHKDNGYSVILTDGTELNTKYIIIATNLQTGLLERLGFELTVNEKVPSGKIKKVLGIEADGSTHLSNLYITSLLAGIPSQSVIAAGHRASIAITIVTRETGKVYMWHDK
ncbi:pyridine nucleotide-disulfide oxidoreductase [Mesobacillus subterraneus]|uniref:pyridine nucleotide-disulfide oxidoreductase n=1 Tax=Mesobacillus subterraneus TaxID=285983 RepID=UPI001FE51E3D|nr:pyridine nucleotide-disulfide oxidoreductase [Mesobacillus subterraneus]